MSPRVQAQTILKRFRTPRIPFLLSRFDFASKALTKGFSLFDQSFFIVKDSLLISALAKSVSVFDQNFFIARGGSQDSALMKRVFLFDQSFFIRVFPLKDFLLNYIFSQFYICFPTSVF